MKTRLLTMAAGAMLAIASLLVPTGAAEAAGPGLLTAPAVESNVTRTHGYHVACAGAYGWGWHRHRRNGSIGPCLGGVGVGVGVGPGGGVGVGVTISDARLKTDIVKLASLDDGIGLYSYRLIGDDRQRVGVMAQEVAESAPHAVLRNERGYYLVDYDALFANADLAQALEQSGYQLAP